MGGRGAFSGFVDRVPNHDKATIAEAKISRYLLKPGTRHYDDFISVGYSSGNPEKLKRDLLKGLSENTAEGTYPNNHGDRSFTVYMKLGVTKRKLFRTGWQIDKGENNPRFVTAYRVSKKGK